MNEAEVAIIIEQLTAINQNLDRVATAMESLLEMAEDERPSKES